MKRILLIEDDQFFSNRMRKGIVDHFPDLEIDLVATKAQMEQKLEKNAYDLVLSDLILPDSDGEHIQTLIERGESVVIVTGDSDMKRKEYFLQNDIVDYVLKSQNAKFEYLLKLIGRLKNNAGKKILIVEDSKTVKRLFVQFMARQHLKVLQAQDGVEALEIVEKEAVDLILSDYNMPRMDGMELLKKIRSKHDMIELPFIAISSDENKETVGIFLKLGANDYLKKPFNKEELLCRVNNALDMMDMVHEIKRIAITDTLTDLHNRRYLYEIAPAIIASAKRYEMPFSVVLFDIDHFKRFNDTYGHLTGDLVLKRVAEVLKKEVRKADYAFRFGGEEFLLLLPETDMKRAFIVAEKIRKSIESVQMVSEEGERLHVTISGGVAEFAKGMNLEKIIHDADEALYRAKDAGRNRIEMASQ